MKDSKGITWGALHGALNFKLESQTSGAVALLNV